ARVDAEPARHAVKPLTAIIQRMRGFTTSLPSVEHDRLKPLLQFAIVNLQLSIVNDATPQGQSCSPGNSACGPIFASCSLTLVASARYVLATGESGYLCTMGSPVSPHSATRGSMGMSPR